MSGAAALEKGRIILNRFIEKRTPFKEALERVWAGAA
jgi:hypothetical protein